MESSAVLPTAVAGGGASSGLIGLGLGGSPGHIVRPRLRICRLTPPAEVGWRRRRRRQQLCVPVVRCLHGRQSSAAAGRDDPRPSFSAIAEEAISVLSSSAACPGGDESIPRLQIRQLADEFRALPEPIDRVKRLLEYAAQLPPLPEADRTPANRVMGCTAQVWLAAAMDEAGRMRFAADSDSEITRGFCACLVSAIDGAAPEEVMEMRTEDLAELNVVGGAAGRKAPSRVNTWHNVLVSMQKRTKALVAQGDGRPPVEPFPSLVIGLDGFEPKGSYAEAQVSSSPFP